MPWEKNPNGPGHRYVRPRVRPEKPKTLAEQFNADQAAREEQPRVRVAGDGLGRLRKGEQYAKANPLDSLEVQGS